MSDSEDGLDGFVPLRPHSAGPKIQPRRGPIGGRLDGKAGGAIGAGAAGASATQAAARKPFRPKPPSERRKVETSSLTSASKEESASAILQNALRRSEALHSSGAGLPFIPEAFQGMSARKFGIADNLGLTANAQSFSSGGAASSAPPPRKAKDRGAGKSLELADLAFTPFRRGRDGITRESYAPISLPYYNFAQADGDGGNEGQSARPTLHHIDERNSNAARELFLNDAGDLLENKFFLMQLPAVLPELLDHTEEFVRSDDPEPNANSADGPGPTLSRLPDGKIGKLKIHKSGKVRMEIAGLPFCVDQGSAIFFQQELGCICPLAKEYVNLGAVQSRVVLTPDVAALLEQMEQEKAAAAAAAESAS